jgi:hypothetical protein
VTTGTTEQSSKLPREARHLREPSPTPPRNKITKRLNAPDTHLSVLSVTTQKSFDFLHKVKRTQNGGV